MARFVVETYLPRLTRSELRALRQRLRRAAEDASRGGQPVRHVRSVHVPDDETCFHFFEAGSAQAIEAAGAKAGIVFDRIAEALG